MKQHLKKGAFVLSRYTLDPETGEISGEADKHMQPSVLPMTSFDLYETMYVMALKTGKGVFKGTIYRVDTVYQTGRLIVRERSGKMVPGLFPFDWFAEMLEVPSHANENHPNPPGN